VQPVGGERSRIWVARAGARHACAEQENKNEPTYLPARHAMRSAHLEEPPFKDTRRGAPGCASAGRSRGRATRHASSGRRGQARGGWKNAVEDVLRAKVARRRAVDCVRNGGSSSEESRTTTTAPSSDLDSKRQAQPRPAAVAVRGRIGHRDPSECPTRPALGTGADASPTAARKEAGDETQENEESEARDSMPKRTLAERPIRVKRTTARTSIRRPHVGAERHGDL